MKTKKGCVRCSKPVPYPACKFCKECIEEGWHTTFPDLPYKQRTLGYELNLCKHKGANRFNKIRGWARFYNKDSILKCSRCGYDKHVEVAHKKPIASFPLDTLLTTINSKENLLFLCPNCHWEHDHT